MIVEKCFFTSCPHRFVDPKPIKERQAFDLSTFECPDIIHCMEPNGICVNRLEQLKESMPTEPVVHKKSINIQYGEKTILYAQEGTEFWDMIMNLADGGMFEHHGIIYTKNKNCLNVFLSTGSCRYDMKSPATKYRKAFYFKLPDIQEEKK